MLLTLRNSHARQTRHRYKYRSYLPLDVSIPMDIERPAPHADYALRLDQRRAAAAHLERWQRRIGNRRLALFAVAAGLGWFTFKSHLFSRWWLLIPLGAFISLVIVHERILGARRKMERAAAFYERGIARLENHWMGTGEQGSRFLDPRHPYAQDLDLFGHASLFELLCAARTRAGEDVLASWLKSPATPSEIRSRQASVSELRQRLELREDLAVLGLDVRAGVDPDALTLWSNAPPLALFRAERIGAFVIATCVVAALLALMAIDASRNRFLAAVLIELGFIWRMRARVGHIVHAVERPGRDLALLSQVLARLECESFNTPRLVELRRALDQPAVAID